MKLKLALLGYNSDLSLLGLKQLAENNMEQVISISMERRKITFKDGSQITALTHGSPWRYEGCRFDQLILFDDSRWNIESDKTEMINLILHALMYSSRVPDEFRIIKYEDIRL